MLLLVSALALGGLAGLPGLPVSLFPNTPFPRVVVSLDAGDRPADRMVVEVTRPVEEAVRSVPGVRNVRSNSSRGSADVSVDFEWNTEMFVAALQVESAIAGALPELPAGLRYEVRRMDPTVFPVLGLSLRSETRSLVELRDLALYSLAPALSTVEGVARVRVLGGERREIQVLVESERLEASGLTLENVVEAVSAANVVEAVGRLEDQEKLYLLLSDTQFPDLSSIGKIVLRETPSGPLLVNDVASVRSASAPQWTRVVADGRDSVLLNVYQQPGGDTVRIAAEIRSRMASLRRLASSSVDLRVWYDQSELIRASVGSVRDAIAVGVAIAIAILWLFLRNARITVVTAVMVPVVLAGSLLVLRGLGMGLNIMTLGGMAAAVGLVVDDSIVMVEHIVRRLRTAPADHRTAVLRAAREMARPLTASSAATIIIFAPLAYLTGVTGAFFKAFSSTMASTLLLSYVVAYLAVPLLANAVLRERDARTEDAGPRTLRWLDRYERLLRALLRQPALLILGIAPLLAGGLIGYRAVGTEFLPSMDEGGFVLDYVATAGTSLSETDRRLRQVEEILADVPEVAAYSRRTGLALGGHVTEANEGDYFVRLRPPPRRPIGEVMDEIRSRIDARVPGLEIELAQLMGDLIGDLTAVPQPIEVKLFGDDQMRLRQQARAVSGAIEAIPGVVDVKSGTVLAGDAIAIRVDRAQARTLGLDPEQVTRLARIAFQGVVATQLQRCEKMVGVRVWTVERSRGTLDDLEQIRLRTPDGRSVRLGRVASFTRVVGQPQIARENLKTMVAVTGRITGRDLGSAMHDVRSQVGGLDLPESTTIVYGGLYREQQRSFRGLVAVLGAATLLVLVLLLYLYESFAAPVAILTVAGLASWATFVGLWWTGTDLDISAMMGLTMIVGISAEASIFLMSEWKECSRSQALEDALVRAGRLRLRPILMTALAAAGALLPLALAIGEGAAMLRSLAIAIISGLAVTVPGVLLVLPVLFASLAGRTGGPGSER